MGVSGRELRYLDQEDFQDVQRRTVGTQSGDCN